MEFILTLIAIFMILITGLLLMINSKYDKIGMVNMAWIITIIAFASLLLLVFMYPSHPECNDMINHNNVTLQLLQDKCYQYINF